jgi:hypothetical protein
MTFAADLIAVLAVLGMLQCLAGNLGGQAFRRPRKRLFECCRRATCVPG